MLKLNDKVAALNCHKLEMNAYWKELFEDVFKKPLTWDFKNTNRPSCTTNLIVMTLNRLSNAFGLSWSRGVLYTLFVTLLFFTLYTWCLDLPYCGECFADTVKQLCLAHYAARIEVQRQSDLFLRNSALDGPADHLVLLNGRKAADPLIVGEGLVVRGDQTFDPFDAKILQHLYPDVPIEQHIGVFLTRRSCDDGRFDQANLFD